MDVLELIGRLAFAAIFISSGPNHLLKREQMTAYARSVGAPAAPLAVPLTGLMIIGGEALVAPEERDVIRIGELGAEAGHVLDHPSPERDTSQRDRPVAGARADARDLGQELLRQLAGAQAVDAAGVP